MKLCPTWRDIMAQIHFEVVGVASTWSISVNENVPKKRHMKNEPRSVNGNDKIMYQRFLNSASLTIGNINIMRINNTYRSDRYQKPQKKNTRPGDRKCLQCGRGFSSKGIHNRICTRCKDTLSWREGSNPFNP